MTASSHAERIPLGLRLSSFLLKSAVDTDDDPVPRSADEIQAEASSTTDKERVLGLLGAPVAALIGFMITGALLAADPAAKMKSGLANPHHVAFSVYYELGAVIVGLSVIMLLGAMLKRRTLLGVTMALYGLAVFNLHFWGFGVPYIIAASWLLVRAYRLQKELKSCP